MDMKLKIGKKMPPSGSPSYELYDFHPGFQKHLSHILILKTHASEMVTGCNMDMTLKIGKKMPPSGSPGYELYDFHHGFQKHLSLGVARALYQTQK